MSFRTRLFLAVTPAVLLPLAVLGWGVRREMERRLGAEYDRRAGQAAETIRSELERESADVADRLAALAAELESDNRIRSALVRNDAAGRRALLDWAGEAMRLSGLDLLELQDAEGRILSSGHFRNEFDLVRPAPARAVAAAGRRPVLVRARTAEGSILALARLDSLSVAGRPFVLLGGVTAERLVQPPAGGGDISYRLILPGAPHQSAAGGEAARVLEVPYLDAGAGGTGSARLAVVQSGATLAAIRRGLDRWILAALAASIALGLAAAGWLSARISRPLHDLASRTEAVDLERLDQEFASDRTDEIGTLARVLGAMTGRLRASAARLREAERRVAMGDLARQVNHDIKNGLAPIRNVIQHLSEVARDEPAALAGVFVERRGTLDSSIAYLDTLARNYARLSPAAMPEPCDVNAVVREAARSVPGTAAVRIDAAPDLGPVTADRLALRRVVENLLGNAADGAAATGGTVTVSTEAIGKPASGVRITVADTGPGMTRAQLDRAFEGFYTTKDGGTGLGLSIVRRLVLDLGGSLRVETEPGEGTRMTIDLPAAGGARG